MAEIVLALGSSHSPMLGSPGEDYPAHAEIDRGRTNWKRTLLDKHGQPTTYEELLQQAPPDLEEQVTLEVMQQRAASCRECVEHLSQVLAGSDLDALIVVGDDQMEQFHEDNMPAVSVYWGETILNSVLTLAEGSPAFWKKARSIYHEESAPREYPVASELGRHLIEQLIDSGFDVSHSRRLPRERGEGHAFGFVHRQLMRDKVIPMLPIAMNTYFPPNQPPPRRCYALGQAIHDAVRSWHADRRIGILASGGLSHFTVNEELDRKVLEACRSKDRDSLVSLPPALLSSGSSEIRTWITIAGAAEQLELGWSRYISCYRSPAGTGTGMGFAVWS